MKINKPNIEYCDVLDACINSVRNVETRKSLNAIKPKLIQYGNEYDEKAKKSELNKIQPIGSTKSKISKKAYINLYNNGLVKSKKGREYYDKIMIHSSLCPYCGVRECSTLDHYLPKSKYLQYTIFPLNLVPCCHECNKNKLDDCMDQEFYPHPYYDDYNRIPWLSGNLSFDGTILQFSFYVSEENLDQKSVEKVKFMFKNLKLNELYSQRANLKFSRYRNHYKNLYLEGGEEGLYQHFESNHIDLETEDMNDFEKVYYRILMDNVDIVIDYLNKL